MHPHYPTRSPTNLRVIPPRYMHASSLPGFDYMLDRWLAILNEFCVSNELLYFRVLSLYVSLSHAHTYRNIYIYICVLERTLFSLSFSLPFYDFISLVSPTLFFLSPFQGLSSPARCSGFSCSHAARCCLPLLLLLFLH